jgi:hypothetical protein
MGLGTFLCGVVAADNLSGRPLTARRPTMRVPQYMDDRYWGGLRPNQENQI